MDLYWIYILIRRYLININRYQYINIYIYINHRGYQRWFIYIYIDNDILIPDIPSWAPSRCRLVASPLLGKQPPPVYVLCEWEQKARLADDDWCNVNLQRIGRSLWAQGWISLPGGHGRHWGGYSLWTSPPSRRTPAGENKIDWLLEFCALATSKVISEREERQQTTRGRTTSASKWRSWRSLVLKVKAA